MEILKTTNPQVGGTCGHTCEHWILHVQTKIVMVWAGWVSPQETSFAPHSSTMGIELLGGGPVGTFTAPPPTCIGNLGPNNLG